MTEGPNPIALDIDSDKIAWLTLDQSDSRVNLLGSATMGFLDQRFSELESRIATGQPVAIVIRSGKPGTFIVGADVREFGEVSSAAEARARSHEGQRIFQRLSRLTVPTIAAIDGSCMGGGTELALACDWRIASDRSSTKIGLPEVKLGIIPAWGGCVRLPRLIGIQRALRMILRGDGSAASKAKRWGLADRVFPADGFEEHLRKFVVDIVLGQVERSPRAQSFRDRLLEGTGPGRTLLFNRARKEAVKTSGGHYPAPLEAIDVIEKSLDLSLDDALAVENEGLARMAETEASRNLVRLFLLGQAARRALPEDVLNDASETKRVAVLGAGIMGGGIAELVAAHDVPVVMKDIDQGSLDAGLHHASDLLRKAGDRGIFAAEEVGLKFALIHGSLEYDGFDDVDLVIEAVVERMPVKQQVLRECEEHLPAHAVFATNTSSLSVTELASASGRPAQVVGLHFFNPVHRMPLVEVVRADRSSDAALACAFRFVGDMGKTPVLVADRPGFLVNRLLGPYLNEAGYLLEQGAPVAEVDRVLTEFGMPMGPCRLLDEVGFDVAQHVAREMERAFGERMKPSAVVGLLTEDGRLGRKNGRGFYSYPKGRQAGVDREVGRLLAAKGSVSADDIRDRCLFLLVNEAVHALADEVVGTPGDVDLAMVMGTGFPPFRGGILQWADTIGAPRIRDRLLEFESAHGPRFAPAPGLKELADIDGSFTAA
ncbi:MAG: 3-hydroxyacyl-CoA dehydrogenase NAD-binding domain-containing protein [Gemmatimonadota bacterium]|nr:3-hydroxyacyl-CoA dehydrogenase NAD-binding domain-containing protein [Gemmatimonadota bacterium]